MKIAVVGSGIAGLACAHQLRDTNDLTVFDAADRPGGHANTVRIDLDDETHHVDTGFIVYNERNYPRFTALLDELGVATQPSEMSFSVSNELTGHEWSGSSLAGLVGNARNLASLGHWRMLAGILAFNRHARRLLADTALASEPDESGPTLGEFLERHRVDPLVIGDYVIPLGASIWSVDPTTFDRYPAVSLFRFLDNHRLLSLGGRPQWRTVTGGSTRYVESLTAGLGDRLRLSTSVVGVRRDADGVALTLGNGETERVDHVILACHSDQARRLLTDATTAEQDILGAIRYQPNVATLHTDASLLPRARRTWASWNYHVTESDPTLPTLTYWMNRLQGLSSRHQICVTLNRHDEIDPDTVLGRFEYDHPVFDRKAVAARARRDEIQGRLRTWFVGAYWGDGFHEDGMASADDVVAALRSPAVVAT